MTWFLALVGFVCAVACGQFALNIHHVLRRAATCRHLEDVARGRAAPRDVDWSAVIRRDGRVLTRGGPVQCDNIQGLTYQKRDVLATFVARSRSGGGVVTIPDVSGRDLLAHLVYAASAPGDRIRLVGTCYPRG